MTSLAWIWKMPTLILAPLWELPQRTQIFQHLTDAVLYVIPSSGFQIVNYVDDYVDFGMPSMAKHSFNALYDLLCSLGLQ